MQEGIHTLDTFEIALDTCRKKKLSGQSVTNPAGLIVKPIRDQESDRKLVNQKPSSRRAMPFANARRLSSLTPTRRTAGTGHRV